MFFCCIKDEDTCTQHLVNIWMTNNCFCTYTFLKQALLYDFLYFAYEEHGSSNQDGVQRVCDIR